MQRYRLVSFGYKVSLIKSNARLPHQYERRKIRENFYFFAELKDTVDENLHSNEGVCKWFSMDEICELEMPLTAKYMMEHYCKVGRFTDKVYVGVTYPDRMEFHELVES